MNPLLVVWIEIPRISPPKLLTLCLPLGYMFFLIIHLKLQNFPLYNSPTPSKAGQKKNVSFENNPSNQSIAGKPTQSAWENCRFVMLNSKEMALAVWQAFDLFWQGATRFLVPEIWLSWILRSLGMLSSQMILRAWIFCRWIIGSQSSTNSYYDSIIIQWKLTQACQAYFFMLAREAFKSAWWLDKG